MGGGITNRTSKDITNKGMNCFPNKGILESHDQLKVVLILSPSISCTVV